MVTRPPNIVEEVLNTPDNGRELFVDLWRRDFHLIPEMPEAMIPLFEEHSIEPKVAPLCRPQSLIIDA
eukprot:128866-Lingulodinium_polyedra.AAC.1